MSELAVLAICADVCHQKLMRLAEQDRSQWCANYWRILEQERDATTASEDERAPSGLTVVDYSTRTPTGRALEERTVAMVKMDRQGPTFPDTFPDVVTPLKRWMHDSWTRRCQAETRIGQCEHELGHRGPHWNA